MKLDTKDLMADCSRCAALCCMAPPFEVSEDFALTKAAEEPCPKLDGAGRCTIHASRAEEGFRGCIAADCFGAGQRVTQELFQGRSWLDDPSLKAPMAAAYSLMRRIHELLILLEQAEKLPLTDQKRVQAGDLIVELNQLAERLNSVELGREVLEAETEVHQFLRTLAPLAK